MLPKDPYMLLSAVNMKLRDEYSDLHDLCKSLDIDEEELIAKLKSIDYSYDAVSNQFK